MFPFTILLLAVYLIGLKFLSYFAHRISTRASEDYFLASRNIGLMALIGTTMASIFSTGTVVSSPSEFYRQGSSYFFVFFFAFMPVVYFFLATKMWRLGKAKGYITPGDMLGDFYKSKPSSSGARPSACGRSALRGGAVGRHRKTFEP